MRFVKIVQFNRRPTLMAASLLMARERAGYRAQGASVQAAYEQAAAQLESETVEDYIDVRPVVA